MHMLHMRIPVIIMLAEIRVMKPEVLSCQKML
jgi:hypothetical protein